jgi:pyridoxal phosphate enzyme (YggS family)
VKQIVPFISLIHGVDSLKLLETINREAEKCNRVIPILLEFRIATEETKYGLTLAEAEEILTFFKTGCLNYVTIAGVMGMATFTADYTMIKNEFERLNTLFHYLKEQYFSQSNQFCEISMGMSDDYPIAILAGSTMVRIGSKIFGSRTNG